MKACTVRSSPRGQWTDGNYFALFRDVIRGSLFVGRWTAVIPQVNIFNTLASARCAGMRRIGSASVQSIVNVCLQREDSITPVQATGTLNGSLDCPCHSRRYFGFLDPVMLGCHTRVRIRY